MPTAASTHAVHVMHHNEKVAPQAGPGESQYVIFAAKVNEIGESEPFVIATVVTVRDEDGLVTHISNTDTPDPELADMVAFIRGSFDQHGRGNDEYIKS